MKKSLIILSMATVALVAALSGCQREMGPEDGPGAKDGAGEVVTSFVFNVSTSASRTKQTAADTQAEGSNFRGIVDTKLMAFYNLGDARDGSILTVDVDADKVYDLAKFADESRISSSQSRRILEMSLPLKTNIMVLYGRAGIPSSASVGTGLTMEDKYGALAADNGYYVSSQAGVTDFALRKRLEDSDRYYNTEKVLAGLLTVIMNTALVDADGTPGADEALSESNNEGTDNPYGFNLPANSYPAVKWSDYSQASVSPVETTHELYPLEEQLRYVYNQMTTIKSEQGELRSAAGEDILRIIKDLWSNVNSIRCAAPISEAEAVAKHLAQHIHEHLQEYFSTSSVPTDGAGVSDCSFKSLTGANSTGLIHKLDQDPYWPSGCGENKPALIKMEALEGVNLASFPFNFNMPRGVSYMAFDSATLCFYYPQYFNTSAVTGDPTDQSQTAPSTGVSYDASSYFYPAEILYFGNSPVRTSDLEHKTADYPGSTQTGSWEDESKWSSDWTGSHVVSSTRSVAMRYSINYGVAMLETKVGYKSGLTSLKDNNHAIQAMNAGFMDTVDPENPQNNKTAVENYDAAGHALDEPDKIIPLSTDSFKLTGVIIGGQPVHVGWNFLPQKENSTDPSIKTGFIYDKAVANQTIPTPEGGENYTVVFDNFNAKAYSESKDQDKVFVALEFQNNTGTDFYGNCNLIRDGGYFYLIACLDPKAVTEDANKIQWPRRVYDSSDPAKLTREISHIVPPYNTETGQSLEVSRVFVQDFVTRATFNFGENSLKYAYLTVPDLRSSSVSIGLSVDIQWGHGLVYEDVILGGE